MKIVARAPAKLVLFGEYAVLEDAPAIVAAVDRCAVVTVEPHDETVIASDLGTDAGDAWYAAWREASALDVPAMHVDLSTAEFYANGGGEKLGIGSSAALAVAMGAAARRAAGEAPDDDAAFAADLDTHHRLQGGGGSGIDVAASFHGGVIAWWKSRRMERLAWPEGLHFACVWTGASASTADMLARVREFERTQPDAYAACIEAMSRISGEALAAFRAGRVTDIVAQTAAYSDAMSAFGREAGAPIVSEAHAALAKLAAGLDVSYKPSGAGGGDVGLLFSTSRARLQEACEQCLTAGYPIVNVRIHDQGVTVSDS